MAHDDLHRTHADLERRVHELSLELARKTEALDSERVLRQSAEDALRAGEATIGGLREQVEASGRIRGLLDTAPDAMVVVEGDGRITFVNVRAEDLFGYARSELLGQRVELLIPERFRRAHGGHVNSFFANPGARAMGSRLDLFGRRKDGTELPIEVSLSPLRTDRGTTVSAAIRDVSERKRLDAAATLAAERLASAVESIEEAFALFDREDRLVLCNSVFRALIGDALPGSLVGRSYEELLDAWVGFIAFEDEAARVRFRNARLQRRHRDPSASFDLRLRDGRSLRVVDRPTAEGGIVKTIWDMTEDVRLADELREARAAADAANVAKSEFLSSMSHELRTPLNAILGFAQLLQRDKKEPLSERHQVRLSHILKGGEHLLHLINDILDLSRIEAGALSMSIERVHVLEVLQELRETLSGMAASRGILIEVEDSLAQHQVMADRTRYAQVLMNLATNAIKYNRPNGKVTFKVSKERPSHVRVTVRDTGVGIASDKQDKLFQPFQRAGQESGSIEGTGIGLVITRKLAHMMAGAVGFHSVAGEGSEFWVDIPVHDSPAQASQPAAPVLEVASGRPMQGDRPLLLYVEDNPANVSFMYDLVGTLGNVDLITAGTAEVGIELARTHQPKVVIMDINLPGLSGLDALRVLRAAPETREIPVIALSAAASERDQQRGMQAGFFRYLTKPLKVAEFEAVLQALLEAPG